MPFSRIDSGGIVASLKNGTPYRSSVANADGTSMTQRQRHEELSVLGALIGLAGAVAASQAIVTLLFGVTRLDPLTYVGVIGVLLCVSGVACWVPAWRAARVDPVITLRAE